MFFEWKRGRNLVMEETFSTNCRMTVRRTRELACITGSCTILELLFGPYLCVHIVDEIPLVSGRWNFTCSMRCRGGKEITGFSGQDFIQTLGKNDRWTPLNRLDN